MVIYKNNLFLENKEEADDLKVLLLNMLNRNIALNIPIEGNNYVYNNIFYKSDENKFYILYDNKSFRDLHYGESREFYVPDWAKVVMSLKNQERYRELDDFKLPWKKYVAKETTSTLIEGFYKYTKQDKGIGRLDGKEFYLNDTNKMYYIENLLCNQYILDAEKLIFKWNAEDSITLRNPINTVFWRIMQRGSWQNFKVDVYMSIINIENMFNSVAFNISSSHYSWYSSAPIANIYINRSLKGKKDKISSFSKIKYVPRSLTMEESFNFLDSVFDRNSFWCIVERNIENKYIIIENRYHVKMKLICL